MKTALSVKTELMGEHILISNINSMSIGMQTAAAEMILMRKSRERVLYYSTLRWISKEEKRYAINRRIVLISSVISSIVDNYGITRTSLVPKTPSMHRESEHPCFSLSLIK